MTVLLRRSRSLGSRRHGGDFGILEDTGSDQLFSAGHSIVPILAFDCEPFVGCMSAATGATAGSHPHGKRDAADLLAHFTIRKQIGRPVSAGLLGLRHAKR